MTKKDRELIESLVVELKNIRSKENNPLLPYHYLFVEKLSGQFYTYKKLYEAMYPQKPDIHKDDYISFGKNIYRVLRVVFQIEDNVYAVKVEQIYNGLYHQRDFVDEINKEK